ncbi:MAG: phosphatase PAP2 family protein [Bacteroidota bacterium]
MEIEKQPFTPLAKWLMGLWILGGGVSLLLLDKSSVVLALNQVHNPLTDRLMVAWTFLGDGLMFAVALLFLILFVRIYHVLPLLTAVIIQTVLVHLGKRVIFKGAPRPKAWLEQPELLHYVEGVKVHLYNSFPSGHTATAFTLALLVMMFHRRTWSTLLAFVLAAGVGVSRMYLVLHFWEDVIVGSVVSVLTLLATWALFYRGEPGWARKGLWSRKVF